MTINIAGLDKAEVLAALHNGTRAMGMGALHDIGGNLSVEDARKFIEKGDDHQRMFGGGHGIDKPIVGRRANRLDFDYLLGRPLKVDITGDEFDEWGYDRDAGQGAAARAIDAIRPKDHRAAS